MWQEEREAINSVFSSHNVRARVRQTVETPATVFHLLEKAAEVRVADVAGVLDELKLALSEHRRKTVEARFSSPPMILEVPHPSPRPITVPVDDRYSMYQLTNGPFQMLCGRSYSTGRPVDQILDLRESPHTLIAGITGSGKSMLGKVMALSLARHTSPKDLGFYVVDMKLDDYLILSDLPHTRDFADDRRADEVIAKVLDLSHQRRRSVGAHGARVVLWIDEKARLSKDALAMVGELLALGRSQGIHVVSATQHPTTQILGGAEGKVNYTTRLVGRVLDASASSTASGVPKLGAEKLEGSGAFVRVDHIVGTERFQGYLLPRPESLAAEVQRAWGSFGVPVRRTPEAPMAAVESRGEPERPRVGGSALDEAVEPLARIFAIYSDGRGGLKRGGLAEAIRALYGEEARDSGSIYQEQREAVLERLSAWLNTSMDTSAETSGKTSKASLPSVGSSQKENSQRGKSVGVWF